jgi:UDP-galactopyranose mutase
MIESKIENLILGGGLAGLSACYHGNGIVFEKDNSWGGHARSHCSEGFVFDEGIHVLHTDNEYILDLCEKIDVDLEVKERDAWIFSHGAMTRYPFQANTYGLPSDIVRECLLGFIENNHKKEDIRNYEDWVRYIFGDGIADSFMLPYSKKFWGVDPKTLTTDWVNVRHPRPSMEEVITGAISDQKKGFGINASFRYPKKGGFGYIGERLAKYCEGRINSGMKATNIDINQKIVTFNNHEEVSYNNLLSTIPLPELLNIIPETPKEVIDASNKLKTNSIYVVNLGVDRANITDKSWIYYLEKEFSFVRVSFPFNFTHSNDSVVPEGCSSISVEIAYGNDNPLPLPKTDMAKRAIEDLKKANILLESDNIVYQHTYDIKYGYVIYDQHKKQSVKEIHDFLKPYNIIPCGRYGLWAYLWSDEAIMSGKVAAEKL